MDQINYKKIFDDSIEDLISLLQIPSIYDENTVSDFMPYGQNVYDALCFMRKKALSDGFEVLEYDNHAIAIRYRKDCSKRIDIVSHLDVVEVGEGWNVDPFSAKIIDGKCYARGTQDMKTCAWVTYLALKILREKYPKLDCEVRIVLGCDEERTMNDMRYYVEKAGKPDFAFTPDGYFPLGLGEKGALMWRLKGKYDGIVEMFDGGVQCNVISPSASCLLKDDSLTDSIKSYIDEHSIDGSVESLNGKTKIHILGKAAHCSRPQLGHNATIDLLEILSHYDGLMNKMYSCFKDAYGSGCECLFDIKPMGPLTMNLGIFRIINGNVYGEVDSRYPYGITSNELTSLLQKNCPFMVSLDYDDKPTLCQEDDIYVQSLLSTYRSITGDMSEPMISGGVSYSKVFEHCVSFGPAKIHDEMLAHQANEYIVLDDCPKYLEIYYKAIESIANLGD